MTLLDVRIPGPPQPKERPRVGRGGFAYTPKNTQRWEEHASTLMRFHWRGAAALDCPVVVEVVAVYERPATKPGPLVTAAWRFAGRCVAIGSHDVDNVAKCAMDALQKAGVLTNDNRVVELRARKVYAAPGEGPAVEVRVWVAEQVPERAKGAA